jgi:hypothetical protein
MVSLVLFFENLFFQLDSEIMSLREHNKTSKQRARCQAIDKKMKKLGIDLVGEGKDVVLVVQCNSYGRPSSGGKTT